MSEKEDTAFVNVRMPIHLAERLVSYAADRKLTKTNMVIKAVEFMVDSIECLSCGAVNPGNGKVCAVCGTPLYCDGDVLSAICELGVEKGNAGGLIPSGKQAAYKPVIDRKEAAKGVKYYCDVQLFVEIQNSNAIAWDSIVRIDISKEELLNALSSGSTEKE